MMRSSELKLGELYMEGRIVPGQCSIADVLNVLMLNLSLKQIDALPMTRDYMV